MASSEVSSQSEEPERDEDERDEIREDLKTMSFEEMLKLKEELGAKLYKEAVLGIDRSSDGTTTRKKFKRLNKNRPREVTAKHQVPFLGGELRTSRESEAKQRDPRFDANCGDYNVNSFKENYKFLTNIRRKEVYQLQKQIEETTDKEEKKRLTHEKQKLLNKNIEERNWHAKQAMLKEEQQDIRKAREEGRKPHFVTKKERRAKELVMKFEQLKKSGKLNKHLEKRRKKNAAKDRKILGFS